MHYHLTLMRYYYIMLSDLTIICFMYLFKEHKLNKRAVEKRLKDHKKESRFYKLYLLETND